MKTGRGAQVTPKGDWRIWLVLAGRGWGKTRAGAEDAAHYALWNPGARVGVVAPTYTAARGVCVEGESGLLKALPAASIRKWRRSEGELLLHNGSRFLLYSADKPERLRGAQFHRAWADELGAWRYPEAAFEQIKMCLRLGADPRLVITTTPRPTRLIRQIAGGRKGTVLLVQGRSEENAAHLAPGVLEHWRGQYGGTPFERQELNGEIIEEPGSTLWNQKMLDANRVAAPPELRRVVIAIDPAIGSHGGSGGVPGSETGIVAAGLGEDGQYYVLADESGHMRPEGWARRVKELRAAVRAGTVLAEINEGGDMVGHVLRLEDPHLPYKPVRASKSKGERAVPVSILYAKGNVHHVGTFAALEEQMTRFTLQGLAHASPDRVDALVWAILELMNAADARPCVRRI